METIAQETTDVWLYFHKYNHLVNTDMAEQLTCPNDGGRYYLRGKWENDQISDLPRLYCYRCGRTIVPGSDVINQIKEVVDRYYA